MGLIYNLVVLCDGCFVRDGVGVIIQAAHNMYHTI